MPKLTVGDTVMWRGAWGTEAPLPAIVTDIEVTREVGEKYGGVPATSCDWTAPFIATLDNGHWAFSYQLEPLDSNTAPVPHSEQSA